MSVTEVTQFVLYGASVGVLLAAPIGPINIEIVRRGLRDGFVNGWLTGLGALSADTIYAMVIVMGMAKFAEHESIRAVLFFAGALMMAYIGYNSIRSAMMTTEVDTVPAPRGRSYVTGFLMAALNPFGIVYWLTVGAGLAADAVNRFGQHAAPMLVVGVSLGIFAWVTVISTLAQISRRFVTGKAMQWITGISGGLILGYGVWFLISGLRLLG
ncbi:MAG: LysE family translocator [Thermomicrobiales bacterium]|nr:LysE family translocator [Thermomicrobiales bacterium]MCO5219885.1 LysE family translocator [Thermomicrobiales bacterium]MCO5226229.1 LysE family translocator [Thermomicrobiales bacterium]MCO5227401.1 LysE family translocator [Thermomicrobiales bacterium]